MEFGTIFSYVILAVGILATCLNIYLSFFRYAIYKLKGGDKENYKWVSGVPLIGSLFIWICTPLLMPYPILLWSALTLTIFDTGGIHWFIVSILWQIIFKPKPKHEN